MNSFQAINRLKENNCQCEIRNKHLIAEQSIKHSVINLITFINSWENLK